MTGTDGERKSKYGSIKFIFILLDLKKAANHQDLPLSDNGINFIV
jgi:hypothetical protein